MIYGNKQHMQFNKKQYTEKDKSKKVLTRKFYGNMKQRTNVRIYPLLIMGVFLVFASSCEKDKDNDLPSDNPTNGKTTAVFNPNVTYGTITDQDGNVYKTVTIGTQTWMAENLRTTKYNDGTAIPNIIGIASWLNTKTGAYSNCNNTTSIDSIATYGRLYNWYAVNTGKLAPKGWHVPTNAEWSQLITYLGGVSLAGAKLKETSTSHWASPNTGATNETGFTALPGGTLGFIGKSGTWLSATEDGATFAWYYTISYDVSNVYSYSQLKEMMFSVRCVRD